MFTAGRTDFIIGLRYIDTMWINGIELVLRILVGKRPWIVLDNRCRNPDKNNALICNKNVTI